MSIGSSRIRRPTAADLGAVVALLNACDLAELGAADTAPEDLENDWRMEGFDLSADAWVAVGDDGAVSGYAYAGDQLRDGELEADVWVRPDREEPALAGRLLTLAERRARELARVRGYQDPTLTIFSVAGNHAKRALLADRGFRLVRSMHRLAGEPAALPAAPAALPAGIDIRPLQNGDEPLVHALLKDACDGDGGHADEPLAAWRARLTEADDANGDLWLVAWRGGLAVGVVAAYEHGDLAWVKPPAVLTDERRQGIGGALLARVLKELSGHGVARAELAVEVAGEALPGLYRRAGLRELFAYDAYSKALAPPAV
jgi:GNAT superfamily N-acetyltransferase